MRLSQIIVFLQMKQLFKSGIIPVMQVMFPRCALAGAGNTLHKEIARPSITFFFP